LIDRRLHQGIEGTALDLDDVVADEGGTFARTLVLMLQAALPFEHGPAVVVVLRELGKDRAEVDVAVARRTKPPRPVDPFLIARVDADARARVPLRVLDVERADALTVEIDEAEIVDVLQEEMRGIVENGEARVSADGVEEPLEAGAVVDVLAGMDLEADVDPGVVEGAEDRPPAPRQLRVAGRDQPVGPRRIGIDVGSQQRARERDVTGQPQAP